jgi:hypothetical protein
MRTFHWPNNKSLRYGVRNIEAENSESGVGNQKQLGSVSSEPGVHLRGGFLVNDWILCPGSKS